MRIPRIYHPDPLTVGQEVALTADAANHLGRVLRLNPGHPVQLFNGDNQLYTAELAQVSRKSVTALIKSASEDNRESTLSIHLAQAVSKGDRMDFVLQKATELGVTSFTPLFTEHSVVKLNAERLAKKQEQWQKIVISACEQCGRNTVPEVRPAMQLSEWLADERPFTLTLDPVASDSLASIEPVQEVALLIGPEGGLSDTEIQQASDAGCHSVRIGPRVLRTETAALASVTALQLRFGDLAITP